MKWIYIEYPDNLEEQLPCGYYLLRTKSGRCYTMEIFLNSNGDKIAMGDRFLPDVLRQSITHYCEIIQPTQNDGNNVVPSDKVPENCWPKM